MQPARHLSENIQIKEKTTATPKPARRNSQFWINLQVPLLSPWWSWKRCLNWPPKPVYLRRPSTRLPKLWSKECKSYSWRPGSRRSSWIELRPLGLPNNIPLPGQCRSRQCMNSIQQANCRKLVNLGTPSHSGTIERTSSNLYRSRERKNSCRGSFRSGCSFARRRFRSSQWPSRSCWYLPSHTLG